MPQDQEQEVIDQETQDQNEQQNTSESKEDDFDYRSALLEGQDEDAGTDASGMDADSGPGGEEEPTPEPVASDEPEVPSGPGESEEPSAPQFDAVSYARELGLDVSDPNEAALAFLDGYVKTREQTERLQAEVERLQAIAEAARVAQRPVPETPVAPGPEAGSQQAPAQDSGEERGDEPWWNPPKFDPTWIEKYRIVKQTEDGKYVTDWAPNTPDEVKKSAEAHQAYIEQWAEDLVRKPHEILPKIIHQEARKIVQEMLQETEQQRTAQEIRQTIYEKNRDWMYEHDPITGQMIYDPITNRPQLTEEGREMIECLRFVERQGVTDPQAQWQLAVAMFDKQRMANMPPSSVQSKTAPEVTPDREESRERFLKSRAKKKSADTPDVPGTVSRAERGEVPVQDETLGPGEQLLAQLRKDGVI